MVNGRFSAEYVHIFTAWSLNKLVNLSFSTERLYLGIVTGRPGVPVSCDLAQAFIKLSAAALEALELSTRSKHFVMGIHCL